MESPPLVRAESLGVRFGVASPLSLAENIGERRAGLFDFSEDEIAGAVKDAVDGLDTVRPYAFAQRVEDRDAAARAGLHMQGGVVVARQLRQFRTTLAEEFLVRGNYRASESERGRLHFVGNGRAADHLDDNVDLRMFHRLAPVA